MKKGLLFTFIIFLVGASYAQNFYNMRLRSIWKDSTLQTYQSWGGMPQYYNEIWGWYDSVKQREYAIIGSAEGTHFIDVTNPDSVYLVDYELGKDIADIHRDFKNKGHYLYGVADEGNSSLQIFDMSYLPDSVHKVYDSDVFSARSHNAFIEGDKLYLCSDNLNNGGFAPMRILDISNPEVPTFIADLMLQPGQGSHVHDVYVKNDTAYCSNGTAGLFIFDLSIPTSPQLISSITGYAENGYNHSSWMTDDAKTLFFTDETWGKGIKSYDISDPANPIPRTIFRSNVGAIVHNVFVKGDSLYVSYYHDGVWVFDIQDPNNPYMVAFYDTYNQLNGYSSYQGCWGVYPWLPSGTLLASDFENGLFVLSIDTTLQSGVEQNIGKLSNFNVFPNPVKNKLMISRKAKLLNEFTIHIMSSTGQVLKSEKFTNLDVVQIDFEELKCGMYFLQIETDFGVEMTRICHF